MIRIWILALACPAQETDEGFEKRRTQTEIYPGWETVRDREHPAWIDPDVVKDPASAKGGEAYLRMRTLGGDTSFQ